MRFELLGPLCVRRDGAPIRIGGPREQKVLAALLLHAGRVLPKTQLAAAAWGSKSPATEEAQIHNTIAALRRALGRQVAITRTGRGFTLDLAEHELDLAEFHSHATAADGTADPVAAAEQLRAALALWRGSALDGLTDGALAPEAQRLEEHRLACVERRLSFDIQLGRHADLVCELAALASEYPLRESLVELRMRALCLAGRRADAVVVYGDTRRLLVDELGVDPSPSLQRLHVAILRNQALPPGPRPLLPPESHTLDS